MPIRFYQPGDELAQARIYNAAAASLSAFKPAIPDEIARRFAAVDSDPLTRFYAVEDGEVVGYATFSANGRISWPWVLTGAEALRQPLLESILAEMTRRGIAEAWAAYRADWTAVLNDLRTRGFTDKRMMINYVAEVASLAVADRVPTDGLTGSLARDEVHSLTALEPGLFADVDPGCLERFYWEHPLYGFPNSLVALRNSKSGELRGVSLLVLDEAFADPTKIDASMPCFRLGAFGTERERHKRVNGLFSCVFIDEREADSLLAAALAPELRRRPLTHIAAQVPSDAVALCAWYDRRFQRQGEFPILARRLT
jgi:hypothetical protein